jgi:transposase
MPHALSNDLRERVVEYVEDGKSRREAARRLKVASSTAVRVVKTFRETGSFAPKPRGGYRHGKLPPPDITMPELAAVLLQEKTVTVAPATVSRFLIGCGLSFKKNTAGKRTRQA